MCDSRMLKVCLLLIATLAVFVNCQPPFLGTPRDCPENEVYKPCGPSCQTECATLNQPCYINHIRCPDGCYCNDGFARDATTKCVPIAECSN